VYIRQEVEDALYNNRSIKVSAGCTIEYNMNQMLDNILVTSAATDSDYINTIGWESGQVKRNPFYKLFPIDSIVKPNRPVNPGVKYYILRDSDHEGPRQFYDFRTIPYPIDSPRVYYPGLETSYKYWVSPAGQGINLTVLYSIATASISEFYSTETQIVYKTSLDHGFKVGDRLTVSGTGLTEYNFTNIKIAEIKDSKTFVINQSDGTFNVPANSSPITNWPKLATVVNSEGVATRTKCAVANKIVVKFEKYHYLPASCTVTINYEDSSPAEVGTFSVPTTGEINLYYKNHIIEIKYISNKYLRFT